MSKWRTEYATECGHEVHLLEEWETPRFCKECKAEYDSQFYDKDCEECGRTMRVSSKWDHIPSFCKDCKAQFKAKRYEKPCDHCGRGIPASRDWDHPPKYCSDCKSRFATQYATCDHCGETFSIGTGLQIRCAEHGWELPRKCEKCRELFRHKPFKTVREDKIGGVVFRTYNSLGEFIAESYDEKGFLDDRRRHTSHTGRTVGFTRDAEFMGTKFRETRRTDGSVKSRSTNEEFLGDSYSKSVGGSSDTEHKTRTTNSSFGGKHRKTE